MNNNNDQVFTLIIVGYADVNHAPFGEREGPIHMTNLDCFGTEHKLVECYYRNIRQHFQRWSVVCTNGK